MASVLNWNRPGAVFVAGPATVQLLSGNHGLVVVSTVKDAHGSLLLKANWNRPLLSHVEPISVGGVTVTGMMVRTTCAEAAPQGDCWPVEDSVSVTVPAAMSAAEGV